MQHTTNHFRQHRLVRGHLAPRLGDECVGWADQVIVRTAVELITTGRIPKALERLGEAIVVKALCVFAPGAGCPGARWLVIPAG